MRPDPKAAALGLVWVLRSAHRRRRALRFYRSLVPAGGLCFDVGANVGTRTDVFVRLGARKVVAVEPQPRCVAELRRRFASTAAVVVEPVGVGPPGRRTAELRVPHSSTIASMSPSWIARVQGAGRFPGEEWNESLPVVLTTLDELVERHGVPDFCKIDVEGFELQALEGLTRPLPLLSFEFVPEFAEAGLACVDRLAGLGARSFNFSFGEAMSFALPDWVGRAELRELLLSLEPGATAGDVYARSAA